MHGVGVVVAQGTELVYNQKNHQWEKGREKYKKDNDILQKIQVNNAALPTYMAMSSWQRSWKANGVAPPANS